MSLGSGSEYPFESRKTRDTYVTSKDRWISKMAHGERGVRGSWGEVALLIFQ